MMRRFLDRLPALAVTAAFAGLPGTAPAQTPEQGRLLAQALDEARVGNWTNASSYAGRVDDRVAADIVLWIRLREGVGGWDEYAAFLARNADWPGLAVLRRQAERAMPSSLEPAEVLAFFRGETPQTGTGLLRLAGVLKREEAEATVAGAWPEVSLTPEEQAALLDRFGPALAELHEARTDALLWEERLNEAEKMLPLLGEGWQKLVAARIGVRRDLGNVDTLIAAVPASLAADPGLAYERFQWRVRKERWEEAEAWLVERSTSAEALGRPDLWMPRRQGLARQALARGEVERAYRIAAQNFGSEGADFAEAEWLAGYLALVHLDDPARAIDHFQRFERVVFTPISLGRAGYWLGLAYERSGNAEAAEIAFARGGQHQTSFYGQLAAERAGLPPDRRLSGSAAPHWQARKIARSDLVWAGLLLAAAGDEARALLFFRQAAERMGANERAALAQMLIDLERPHLGLRLAKDAAADGMILASQYYPTHPIAEGEWPVSAEFALAIARQESEFNPGALSHAGARGLMQLMPGTAEQVSRQLGIAYDQGRLVTDPDYNARLGTAYLGSMFRNYGGSYMLAAAAYNAGPGRVSQWLKELGDPRKEVDPVLWIESIPFSETRNYVMRVLEALHVYRARLGGEVQPVRLGADIRRTG